MVCFLLNNTPISLDLGQPDITVMEFLREQHNLCGTKEGCASGDCGACTAVMAQADGKTLTYQNFNSCITFLGSLHGKQLITVEHLKDKGKLHSVQQAMVDQHGSQCGYCTPGFVMSMFCLYKSCQKGTVITPHKIKEFLCGNLCRCTGYKPIIKAVEQSLASLQTDQFDRNLTETTKLLLKINRRGKSEQTGFHMPESVSQLTKLKNRYPEARLLGGGTDLALEVTQQLREIDNIIYLGHVQELAEIKHSNGITEIGAGTTLENFDRTLGSVYPEISTLMQRFGSRQIRNLGTVGGNIANASPIADLPPVFIVLGAELVLQSADDLRSIPIEEYFTDYRKTVLRQHEFIRSIVIPVQPEGQQLKIYKISKRIEDDISAVCLACSITLEQDQIKQFRLAFGGMAAIPKRALNCEAVLTNKALNAENVKLAQQALEEDFQPISDVRASADYRLQVAKNLLERMRLELSNEKFPTQIDAL